MGCDGVAVHRCFTMEGLCDMCVRMCVGFINASLNQDFHDVCLEISSQVFHKDSAMRLCLGLRVDSGGTAVRDFTVMVKPTSFVSCKLPFSKY